MADRINVTRSSMPDFDEYVEEIRPLWESRWLTNMGVKHAELAEGLKEYLCVSHVTLFTNGHLALQSAIAALKLPAGSEVITTPFTFASTTHAIAQNGLTPVFCDIRDDDYTIDTAGIEALITEKTAAIVPVHVYGNVCGVKEIDRIAKKHGLKVVYDAAHAFGVTVDGVSAACFGDMSMFSFHATKVFNTIEGGAVCFNDEKWTHPLDVLKNFGLCGPEEVECVAGNAKMSEFQAAMGLCNLRHLSVEIEKRRKVVEHYRKRLDNISGLKLAAVQDGVESNYAYFPVVFDGFKYSRDEVAAILKEKDIFARRYFYPPTSSFDCYRELPTAGKERTPVAHHISERVLALPLYADLQTEDVDRICDVILSL